MGANYHKWLAFCYNSLPRLHVLSKLTFHSCSLFNWLWQDASKWFYLGFRPLPAYLYRSVDDNKAEQPKTETSRSSEPKTETSRSSQLIQTPRPRALPASEDSSLAGLNELMFNMKIDDFVKTKNTVIKLLQNYLLMKGAFWWCCSIIMF